MGRAARRCPYDHLDRNDRLHGRAHDRPPRRADRRRARGRRERPAAGPDGVSGRRAPRTAPRRGRSAHLRAVRERPRPLPPASAARRARRQLLGRRAGLAARPGHLRARPCVVVHHRRARGRGARAALPPPPVPGHRRGRPPRRHRDVVNAQGAVCGFAPPGDIHRVWNAGPGGRSPSMSTARTSRVWAPASAGSTSCRPTADGAARGNGRPQAPPFRAPRPAPCPVSRWPRPLSPSPGPCISSLPDIPMLTAAVVLGIVAAHLPGARALVRGAARPGLSYAGEAADARRHRAARAEARA